MAFFEIEDRGYIWLIHEGRFFAETSGCLLLVDSLVVALGVCVQRLHLFVQYFLVPFRVAPVSQQFPQI